MNEGSPSPTRWQDYVRFTSVALIAVHVAAVAGVVACGLSAAGVALAVGTYFVRMFVVTAAYHRYFAHRSFKTSRWFQFLLALGAQSAAQRGVLWWASHHRWHHKHSDTADDVHSAARRGFWYAHVGWVIGPDWNSTDEASVRDLARYPELRFLDHSAVAALPTVALAAACLWLGGLFGLVWGYFVPTVLLWHGSFSINSLAHLMGRQRYNTGDDSRNSWILAIVTTGEGWHNNHHHYQSCARQGFHWWQVDVTYYLLRLMAMTGLIWDLREPPRDVVEAPRPEAIGPESAATAPGPPEPISSRAAFS
jgi:stearoyl-CoA desaturase (delta-9 desaturase)